MPFASIERLTVVLSIIDGGLPLEDLHLISSCPCKVCTQGNFSQMSKNSAFCRRSIASLGIGRDMIIREFINYNRKLSRYIESLLPEKFSTSGDADFVNNIIPTYLINGQVIYDVGGGKRPYLSVDNKEKLNAKVIGIDISREELNNAPKGAYDDTIQSAIEDVAGNGDGDLVICNAVLEHVFDVQSSLKSIYSLLKSGGVALIFVPSRNAAFARLNMLLPESFKKKLLFAIFPKKSYLGGFPAYYNNCTPRQFSKITNALGFTTIEEKCYYWSSYFSFFVPIYIIWRIGFFIFYLFAKKEAAEGFVLALKKA